MRWLLVFFSLFFIAPITTLGILGKDYQSFHKIHQVKNSSISTIQLTKGGSCEREGPNNPVRCTFI